MPKENTTIMMDTEFKDQVDRRLLQHELDTGDKVARSAVMHALTELWFHQDAALPTIDPAVRDVLGLVSAEARDGEFVVVFERDGRSDGGQVAGPIGGDESPSTPATATATPTATASEPAAGSSLEELDIPGQGPALDRRREAVAAAADRIKERGRATKGELIEDLDFERLGYQSADSAWKNCLQPGLQQLDGVEATGGVWMASPDT